MQHIHWCHVRGVRTYVPTQLELNRKERVPARWMAGSTDDESAHSAIATDWVYEDVADIAVGDPGMLQQLPTTVETPPPIERRNRYLTADNGQRRRSLSMSSVNVSRP